jgi:hypothetical protein
MKVGEWQPAQPAATRGTGGRRLSPVLVPQRATKTVVGPLARTHLAPAAFGAYAGRFDWSSRPPLTRHDKKKRSKDQHTPGKDEFGGQNCFRRIAHPLSELLVSNLKVRNNLSHLRRGSYIPKLDLNTQGRTIVRIILI